MAGGTMRGVGLRIRATMNTSLAVRPSLLAALLAATVLLSGCGKEPENTAPPTDQTAAPVPEKAAAPVVEIPETGIAAAALAKWTGDLDGMVERRFIRVLPTYSR